MLKTMSDFEAILYRRLGDPEDFFFVQIGANDGVSFDPINAFVTRHRVPGIVVEPVPELYTSLQRTYADLPRVGCVNVAIHRTAESADLYRVAANALGLPRDAWGMASFDRSRLAVLGVRDEDIIKERVPCMSLSALFRKYGVQDLDLLVVDAEGYDYEILAMLDLDEIKPGIIRFEHGRRADEASFTRLREILLRLYDHGYYVSMEPQDVVAYLPRKRRS